MHLPLWVISSLQTLAYRTPAARSTQHYFYSSVSLRVANETLVCSTSFKYHPDPEFLTFEFLRRPDNVLITLQVTRVFLFCLFNRPRDVVFPLAEEEGRAGDDDGRVVTVGPSRRSQAPLHRDGQTGQRGDRDVHLPSWERLQYCVSAADGNSFRSPPTVTNQVFVSKRRVGFLQIQYGDETITLDAPSSSLVLLVLLPLLLIPSIIVGEPPEILRALRSRDAPQTPASLFAAVAIVYRRKQRKLTARMNRIMEDLELDIRNDIRQGGSVRSVGRGACCSLALLPVDSPNRPPQGLWTCRQRRLT